MDISKFLARVLGLYLLILSLFMLLNMSEFLNYVQNLIKNPTIMFVTGFFTLIVGLLMIVSHNLWQMNWRILITIIGWLTFFKGASIIFHPQFIDHLTLLFVQDHRVALMTALYDGMLGLLLCYFGFKREDIHKH